MALLVGAFSLGQAAPSMQDFSVALGAAGFIYDTINRVSQMNVSQFYEDTGYSSKWVFCCG